jgi:NinB protein
MFRRDENEIRSQSHNARFHSMVRDIAKQVPWAGEMLDAESWKRLMLAAKFGQKVVPNPLTGIGFVVMNERRSRSLTNAEMEEMLGELEAFGAERNVDWSEDESE